MTSENWVILQGMPQTPASRQGLAGARLAFRIVQSPQGTLASRGLPQANPSERNKMIGYVHVIRKRMQQGVGGVG